MTPFSDDAPKVDVRADEQEIGRESPLDFSRDELDSAFRRLAKKDAREHKDARRFGCFYASWFVAWFLACLAIGLQDGVAVLILILVAAVLILGGGFLVIQIPSRRKETMESWYLETGHNPQFPLLSRNTLIGFAIASGWSALCFLLTLYYFQGTPWDDSDASVSAMILAWRIFFAGIAVATALVLVIVGLNALSTKLQPPSASDAEMQEFDPRFGPHFPIITSPPSYPMGICHSDLSDEDASQHKQAIKAAIVENLVPYGICVASLLFASVGATYSRWFLFALIGTCIGARSLYQSLGRVTLERRQLRLYQLWHKRFRPEEPLDDMILTLIEQRNDIGQKYLVPYACVIFMGWFVGIRPPLESIQSSTAESSGLGAASVVVFVANVIVFVYWRRDITKVLRRS